MKLLLAVILCFALLFLAACEKPKTSDLITALSAVADASSVSVVVTSSLVAMGKIDPAVAEQVKLYTAGVDQAVKTAITELESKNTNPQKIAQITAAFAKVATPAFGDSAPQVTVAIDAVSAAMKVFLGRLNNTRVLAAAATAPQAKIKLESGDKAALKQIKQKMATTVQLAEAIQ